MAGRAAKEEELVGIMFPGKLGTDPAFVAQASNCATKREFEHPFNLTLLPTHRIRR